MRKTILLGTAITPAILIGSLMFTACQKENEQITPSSMISSTDGSKAHNIPTREFTVDLNSLNNSGVMGTAMLSLTGNELTVHIMASGLEPDMVHAQHIHGNMENNGNATCPPMSADVDGSGLVEVGEGVPFYGPVLLALTPFPTADASGNIDFTMTYTLGEGETISRQDLMPLQNRAIVLHGLTVDGDPMPSLPVACGQVSNTNNGNN